ncbi:MAG: hypothetical protein K9K81_02405, partial [Desulfobacteraceae bacterium]|nr:hypothetical protein [Desulfobacteraceae bacterium]
NSEKLRVTQILDFQGSPRAGSVFEATLSIYRNLCKRSGAKKLTPAARLPSCKNSGRGKKLFTAPSIFRQ